MNPIQESKQELEAAIRYAENAISSANKTIESMATYQEQTGREEALTKQVQELEERNDKLNIQIVEQTNREATLESRCTAFSRDLTAKSKECEQLQDQLNDFRASAFEDAKTIEQLNKEVQRQQDLGQGYYDSMMIFKEKADSLSATIQRLKDESRLDKVCAPTMPVIPKDVAIAIFRKGVKSGVNDACCELEEQTIRVCENEYCGDFEVTFARDINLDEELDLDWMREKVGQYNEEWVVGALKGLCEKKDFKCRIHGVDDQGDDSKSA